MAAPWDSATVERGGVEIGERCAGLQTLYEVGIGDKGMAEGDQVGLAFFLTAVRAGHALRNAFSSEVPFGTGGAERPSNSQHG